MNTSIDYCRFCKRVIKNEDRKKHLESKKYRMKMEHLEKSLETLYDALDDPPSIEEMKKQIFNPDSPYVEIVITDKHGCDWIWKGKKYNCVWYNTQQIYVEF